MCAVNSLILVGGTLYAMCIPVDVIQLSALSDKKHSKITKSIIVQDHKNSKH